MPSQNTIKCSQCGDVKGTTNVRLEKLVKQYGSKEKLEATYVCRSCKSGTNVKMKGGKKRKLPTSKIICSKCGEKFGTTKTRMAKLIGLYGSIEELHSTYVCRKCRKEHNLDKRGRMKPEKRKNKKCLFKRDEQGKIILPEWMITSLGNPTFGPEMSVRIPAGVSEEKFIEAVRASVKKMG